MDRRLCGGLLLLAGMAGVAGCGQAGSQTAARVTPVTEVVYDTPITQVVTDYEDFPGRTDAIYTVEVRARVSGYLKRVYFHDGQEVRKDDLLFLIDPRPFQATLDRQKGALEQADAHAQRLNNEYHRAKILFEQGRSISREEFDRYAFDHAEAEAALSTAKANVDLAALDLEWTRVTADLPEGVTGRLSRRMVDPGNLIKADDTMMTTIVSQDPLYVYFDVHEQAMLRIRRLIQEGKVKARSEKEVPLLIGLSDEKDSEGTNVYPHQGMVDFTDNRVDVNTGTLRFRAQLSNPNQMISPGLFVKVRLPIGEAHPALMVREQALQSDQGLKKVIVLQPKDEMGDPYFITDDQGKQVLDPTGKPIPAYKPVAVDVGTPGVLRNGYREISKGIKAGDLVVVMGMQKIRLGTNPVTKKPYLVAARPFDPQKDSTDRASARPAAGSAAAAADGTAGSTGKSLIGDTPVPAAGSPAGSPRPSSKSPGPAPARPAPATVHDSGSSGRHGR
ncbi:MAG TPA: efflux RND transporter periplasmic adaptor subunit [Isosphaeraceae bacterium]|nr:efflux RND transporter periplasmic adaptor subunit [Isosphaeraceae bacterium]